MEPVQKRLGAELATTVADLVSVGERVALIGFPNYPNAGDSAIWLGEVAALAARGVEVVYSCEDWAYNQTAIRRALGKNGKLILHGGGNFGDEWSVYQQQRERLLGDLPEIPAVVMPQTIRFNEPRAAARAKEKLRRHSDLTVLARDRTSLTCAREELGLTSVLCPDAAFALARPQRCREAHGVLWLSRTDAERRSARLLPPEGTAEDARVEDWLVCRRPGDPGFTWSYQGLKLVSTHAAAQLSRRSRSAKLGEGLNILHESIAQLRVNFAWRLLDEAEVVVTDRLHAHILCLMLGKPHVVVETGYGKIREFVETWSVGGDYPVRMAASAEEAAAVATELRDAADASVRGAA